MRRFSIFTFAKLGFVIGSCFLSACGSRTRLREVGPGDAGPASPGDTSRPSATGTSPPPPPGRSVHFAIIGDFGYAGAEEASVAKLVEEQAPDFVITTGDNNYPVGSADTIDDNIGQYFAPFISPYRGRYGPGASKNRFFPTLGNHDWMSPGAEPYLDYFTLPNNERYYDRVEGVVHLFALDSDPNEPDGIDASSVQATWLRGRLASSTAVWKVVYFHHPPYSSGGHGSTSALKWPFREWGASIVYAGHDHIYERIHVDAFPYVVNGVGGKELYQLGARIPGSVVGFDDVHGAVFVTATADEFVSTFRATDGRVLDELRLNKP